MHRSDSNDNFCYQPLNSSQTDRRETKEKVCKRKQKLGDTEKERGRGRMGRVLRVPQRFFAFGATAACIIRRVPPRNRCTGNYEVHPSSKCAARHDSTLNFVSYKRAIFKIPLCNRVEERFSSLCYQTLFILTYMSLFLDFLKALRVVSFVFHCYATRRCSF